MQIVKKYGWKGVSIGVGSTCCARHAAALGGPLEDAAGSTPPKVPADRSAPLWTRGSGLSQLVWVPESHGSWRYERLRRFRRLQRTNRLRNLHSWSPQRLSGQRSERHHVRRPAPFVCGAVTAALLI